MELEELKRKILEILSNGELSKDAISKALWESKRKVSLAIEELISMNLIYKNGVKYSLQKQPEKPKRTKKAPTETLKTTHGLSVGVLRIVFTVIAVFTTTLSMRNVSVYLMTVYPFPFWLFYAGVLILFIITGTSATIYLWGHKMKSLSCIIGLVAVIAIIYSITCTITGMYNSEKDKFVASDMNKRVDTSLTIQYTTIDDQIADIESLIKDKRVTLNRYNELIAETEDSKTYNTLNNNIAVAERFIATKTEELKALRESKNVVVEKQSGMVVEAPDFNDRLGSVFGWSAALVGFVLHAMGALLLEVLNPISTYLALFMKKEE
jgi:DNA-binding transcriptional ArsR family regulator